MRFHGIWCALLGGSSDEFFRIGMAKFCSVYDVYCESKGITKPNDEIDGYSKYLALRDKLKPLMERNKDKLDAIREDLEKDKKCQQ